MSHASPRAPALLTLSDGVIGARAGSRADDADAGVVAAGVYAGDGPDTALAQLPRWNDVPLEESRTRRRVPRPPGRNLAHGSRLGSRCGAHPRVRVDGAAWHCCPRRRVPSVRGHGAARLCACRPEGRRVPATAGSGTAMEAVASPLRHPSVRCASRPRGFRLERLVAYASDPAQPPRPEAALEALEAAERMGIESLLAEQRVARGRSPLVGRGHPSSREIPEHAAAQSGFSLFHLMASVADRPARRRSGPGVSVAPATVGTSSGTPTYSSCRSWPQPTRRRPVRSSATASGALAAARRRATASGMRRRTLPVGVGAIAATTSRRARSRTANGELVPHPDRRAGGAHRRRRRVGSVAAYAELERGHRRAPRPVRRRADRVRPPATGRRASASTATAEGTSSGVIGPDEYHEDVDDNAFTNAMARWNLRRDAASRRDGGRGGRPAGGSLAADLVDGFDAGDWPPRAVRGVLRPRAADRRRSSEPAADPVDVLGWAPRAASRS